MPRVGGKEFSYSKAGQKKAKEYAKRTGKRITNKNRKPVKRQRGK